MKSLKTSPLKSALLISTAVLTAALTFGSNAAQAAYVSPPHAAVHVAARPAHSYPYRPAGNFPARPGIDVGQLVGAMLGMAPPQYAGIVQRAMRQAASHRSSGSSSGTYDPSFDSPASSTPIDNSASDAGPDTAGMNTATNPTWGALQ
jgi:hypothetical protein